MNDHERAQLELFAHTTPRRVSVSRRRPLVRWSRRLLGAFAAFMGVVLLVSPWRQSARGSGRVVAYSPTERAQAVEAPVKGRIVKWYVQEGSVVRKGDPIVDLADNDPRYQERLERERTTVMQRISAAQGGLSMAELTVASLEGARRAAITNAELYVQISRDKRDFAKQELAAAEAGLLTATLNHKRQTELGEEGLASSRKVELADLKLATANSKRDAAKAKLRAAEREIRAARAKLDNIGNKEAASVAKANETLAKQRSEIAKAEGELAKIDTKVARQESMKVLAPVDGTVLRLTANGPGVVVKPGQQLAQIVPTASARAVELWVAGNDMPLITPGRHVRLQFEGWPAVQFVGWPSTAVGTFGGSVAFVDATDNGKGEFRVVVVPDVKDEPWPQERFLRQGVRANGWVLLDEVSVAFELWRQFNGFPPSIPQPKDAAAAKAMKAGGKK